MVNFNSIHYLQHGNPKQRQAYRVLTKYGIMDKLANYNPVLTGTIPINIDIESSDLDIICYYDDKETFVNVVNQYFGAAKFFKITIQQTVVVANFTADNLPIEIYGQNLPIHQQNAYRHMIIEYK